MMELGIVSHPPTPEEAASQRDAHFTSVRVTMEQPWLDDRIRDDAAKFNGSGLGCYLTVTVNEATSAALQWHAVRTWQRFREAGTIPHTISLLNEPNLKGMGPWARKPADAGLASVDAYAALRADGYQGLIVAGSVSSFGIKPFYWPWETLAGLDYLAAMKPETWPADMGVDPHYYVPHPAPGHPTQEAEVDRLYQIIKGRPLVIAEIGREAMVDAVYDDGASEQAAADSILADLDFWQAHGARACYVYVWTESPRTKGYDITLPNGEWRLQCDEIRAWAVKQVTT